MKLLVLLSHEMQKDQIKEAEKKLGASEILKAPESVMAFWSNVPPEGDLSLEELSKVTDWIEANSDFGDMVLVQGEFGAVFYTVDYCFQHNLVPVYATTKRVVKEEVYDEKVIARREFSHVEFRKYIRFE